VICGEQMRAALAAEMEQQSLKQEGVELFVEPCARNTALPILLAAAHAQALFGRDARVLVLASDHLIGPAETFSADAARLMATAGDSSLGLFGIRPSRAETGYGYIEAGEALGEGLFRIKRFHEKPERALAEDYLRAGNYFWNAGMFVFSSRFILGEAAVQGFPTSFEALKAAYQDAPSVSFDNGIVETCHKLVMQEAAFNWSDVGSWDEYVRLQEVALAEKTNAEEAKFPVYAVKSSNCFVDADMPVGLCGVDDLVVVIKNGACLVMKRGESQEMRELVSQMG
jgi:mannose-1-phosphate guanylyltransferase/mannose-1-phosphate guanylyltransferase/mannose-6-phosphate isomerase